MHLQKDKKILIYCFLFIFLGSINNKYFTELELFNIKSFNFVGLDKKEKLELLKKLEPIRNQNIFSVSNQQIIEILNSNDLIDSFLIRKNYPSNLNFNIKKASFLAKINIQGRNFLIGSNKKLIKADLKNSNLPMVLGNPSLDDFFQITESISKSLIKLKDVNKFHFFKSKRWDLEFKNGILIKLPVSNTVEALNNFSKLVDLKQFNNTKIFDLRINKQIIVNEL